MKYTSINIQGNLISEEILQKIEEAEVQGQLAKDFGFEPGINLRSEIEYAWSRIKLDWKHFSERIEKLPPSDPYGTTLARKWMLGFFNTLGFEISLQKTSLQGDNEQQYTISHTCNLLDGLPVHIAGFYDPNHPQKNTLDIRSSGGTTRMSPHATIQEYLNVTEHLYGMVTNGMLLRLVRDSGHLVKLTYIEFDLKRLLDEDKYSEFTLLYRLLHASRFPNSKQETAESVLEKYYQDSIESGNRIREGLSTAVKESLIALGNGFLQHPSNSAIREKLASGALTPKDYYRQMLRIIYRLLFLMVTEERDLIYNPDDKSNDSLRLKRIYHDFYSITRLRKLSEIRYAYEAKYIDLWKGLLTTFLLFDEGGNGNKLGISPLAGELFSYKTLKDLHNCNINNKLLLKCIRNLSVFYDDSNNLVTVNYRMLDVEELGSVYEVLLDLHPVIENIQSENLDYIKFTFHEGTERKTTGSYYTRPELVNELIKSALIPVIEERLQANIGNFEKQEKALLTMKVCDAASGSGHMLLAAARTIAWYLARVRSGEDNPAPSIFRMCIRDVIQHCIYAVDYNPDAVELCKLALWIEGHNSGKPLSFLDHKIRNGNSLVGVTDLSVLQNGIPSEAYNPITGDDRKVSLWYKKLAKEENKSVFQGRLEFDTPNNEKMEKHSFGSEYKTLEDLPEDNVKDIHKKEEKYNSLRNNAKWFNDWNACNIWTAAFCYTFNEHDDPAAPTSSKLKKYLKSPSEVDSRLVGKATALSNQYKFFHWPLEFPDVFEMGGFDVFLGNPPWERIKLQQKEFFATRNIDIANAPNAAARNRMIRDLDKTDPSLFYEYIQALHFADSTSKFLRDSGRCNLTAVGDINTYSIFAELTSALVNKAGRTGIIVPTGIATDDSNKAFFGFMAENNRLISLFDFENREAIFQSVHRSYKFSLLTLAGSEIRNLKSQFGFFLTRVEHLQDKLRIFSLDKEDFVRLNPNTNTCPVFRTSIDAELSKRIYVKFGVFIDEFRDLNPYQAYYIRLVDLGDHKDEIEMLHFIDDSRYMVPIYEAKLFWQMDHRFSTFENQPDNEIENGNAIQLSDSDKRDANKRTLVRYFANQNLFTDLSLKYPDYSKSYYLVWRDISNSTNERSSIAAIIPKLLASRSCPGIGFTMKHGAILLVSNLNSIIYDYFVRQKISGVHYNWGILKQTPILPPDSYTEDIVKLIFKKSYELLYSAWDIKSFADDEWRESSQEIKLAIQQQWEENREKTGGHKWSPPEWCEINEDGCPLPPFKWNEDRRAVLKAELDAIYANLYGLTTEELRYILDPQDVYGKDFPGETFRVLKEKEIRNYGEYRTKRLVLEAWEKLHSDKAIADFSSKVTIESKETTIPMKEFSLTEGIYSVQDVTKITKIPVEKVRRWFKELSEENYEGLSSAEKTDVDKMRISFHGLVELVVIGTLRDNKFSLRKILIARNDLKNKTGKLFPFATNNVRDDLKVAGKRIVFNFPSGYVTLDGTGQYNLDLIKEFFEHIEFDTDGIAFKLYPFHKSKLIVIDPLQGGGKATISGKDIWVDMIQKAHQGGNSIQVIIDQLGVSENEINAALEYSEIL